MRENGGEVRSIVEGNGRVVVIVEEREDGESEEGESEAKAIREGYGPSNQGRQG